MNKTVILSLGWTVSFCLLGASLRATAPARWVISTQQEFLKGELTGVSVTSDGTVTLAPALKLLLDTEEALVYSLATDRGGNLYLGTGNNGKVFRVSRGGQGKQWARLDQLGVYALAVNSMSQVYAGTSPEGLVYRLSPDGESEVFFDPQQKYIWALITDERNNLFVGTGPNGIIYKVTPKGESSIFYDSKETHMISLEWDLEGNLLAGSAPGALIFRISSKGTPFVLYDSPLQEIKAITVDRYGYVYATGLALGKAPAQKSAAPGSATSKPPAQDQNSEQRGESTLEIAGTRKGQKLEIYRIDRENLVEILYSSDNQLAFDLLIRSDGNLLVATGNRGRILSIDRHRFVTLLVESKEQQVTQLLEREGRLYAATSNLGKLFRLLTQPSTHGVFTSKVLDAQIPSSWGMISWRVRNPASSGVRFYTRSGNTETPDQTWSEWNGPHQKSSGSYIQSPPARYLQWKIEFPEASRTPTVTSSTNAVEQVTISYMQHNMAPRITSITIHPPGVSLIRHPQVNPSAGIPPGGPDGAHLSSLPKSLRHLQSQTTKPLPRRVFVPHVQSLSWSAQDLNKDDLLYSIYYRGEDESDWKLMEEGVRETHYTIDAVSFPDGVYFAKVVVSDHPSNPADQALASELVSKAFIITNSSPRVELEPPQVQGQQVLLTFTARTSSSTVYQAEYSVDAGEWNVLFPEDRVADSSVERYGFTVKKLSPGERSIAIRVVDSVGNIGTGKTTVSIK